MSLITQTQPFIFECFPVPPLGCNCTILGDPDTKDALCVDPGGNVSHILSKLEAHHLVLKRVLITHAHLDHILGAKQLKLKTGCAILLHQDDLPLYERVAAQCRDFGIPLPEQENSSSFTNQHHSNLLPDPDAYVADNDVVRWSDKFTVHCLHCPGHTPGSIAYYFPEGALVCPGDTLFAGSIGRTSWYGIPSLQGTSDSKQILHSIRHKLFDLPPETVVVSGHGDHTSIGHEKKHNPYVR